MGGLEADLGAGVANVSVFPVPEASRNTTRWAPIVCVTPGVQTLYVEVTGNSVSFSGNGGPGQTVGLLVDGQPFVYRTTPEDTPALVAAMLANSVRAVRSCWLSGTTLAVPGCIKLIARIVADATTLTEWGRQEQEFRISVWCSSPAIRDRVCSLVCSSLASTSFLTLPDGSNGRIRYKSTGSNDDNQNTPEYRRDLLYEVEYGTTQESTAPVMLFGDLNLIGSPIYA